MVIDIAAGALNALRDAMNYSFRPDRACQNVEVISDKFAIPLTSAEFANFSVLSVLRVIPWKIRENLRQKKG